MHFLSATGLILAFSLTGQTLAEGWRCLLSADSKFIQNPYCCDGFVKAKGSDVSWEGFNCGDVSKSIVETCPQGGTPKCCYTIGPKFICTTEVELYPGEE